MDEGGCDGGGGSGGGEGDREGGRMSATHAHSPPRVSLKLSLVYLQHLSRIFPTHVLLNRLIRAAN